MDLVLITITAISLVLAIAMGFIVFKLAREERERSEARVAFLAAAAAAAPSLKLRESDARTAAATRLNVDAPSGELFAASDAESPWLRRIGVAVAVAALATVGYALTHIGAGPSTTTSVATKQAAPLELLALQHSQERDSLTISGTVRNPRDGAAVSEVAVSAFVFGPDGNVVASGRAGLDYATLAPGDESPFVLRVPVKGSVSRYRVGFRAADGSVIAHVDRRATGNSAQNTQTSGSTPWAH